METIPDKLSEKGDYETILYFFVLRKVFCYVKEK